jgi:tetratricopeptide (TPR) repeat protein
MALSAHAPAERCFAQAIALDPTQSASHTNLGNLLIERLEPEQALAHLERGVQLDRNSANALFNLGLCHLLLGRFDPGWKYYEARLRTHLVPPESVPTAGPRLTDLAHAPRSGDRPVVVWPNRAWVMPFSSAVIWPCWMPMA